MLTRFNYLCVKSRRGVKARTLAIIFSIIILGSILILPANSQSFRTHDVTASGQIFAVKIPLLGTLKIKMEYSIDFEIQRPSSIKAGDTATISIVPRTGTLYTTGFLDNKNLGTITSNIDLGQRKSMPIVGVVGADIHIFALPTAQIRSSVSGPATISPQAVNLDSIHVQDFQVHVQDNIGSNNQIQVKFPVTLYLAASGGIDLVLTGYDLDPIKIPLTTQTLTENIPIYKNYNTQLTLQVSDGSRAEYIKVYPKLTYDYGNSLSKSVAIYVDGVHKTTVSPNQWSSDIHVGSGSHNIQAKFFESRSSNNNAITYLGSESSIERINVKSGSSVTTQTQSSFQDRQTSTPNYTFLLIILAVAGGGGAAAVIVMKNKKKTAVTQVQTTSKSRSAQVLAKSDEFTYKNEILDKLATGAISKEEFLKNVGYEKKEDSKKSESTVKDKPAKKSEPKKPKKKHVSKKQETKDKGSDNLFKKETIVDKKSWVAIPVELKQGEKLSGKASANGSFHFYITDREHMKKFMKKKNRYYMEFYEEGKSIGFIHEFSYLCKNTGEYLLAILNDEKNTIQVNLEYFIKTVNAIL